jgi:hypothetical protein
VNNYNTDDKIHENFQLLDVNFWEKYNKREWSLLFQEKLIDLNRLANETGRVPNVGRCLFVVKSFTFSLVKVWTSARNSTTSWKCGRMQSNAPVGGLHSDPSEVGNPLANRTFWPSSSSRQFGGKVPPASCSLNH